MEETIITGTTRYCPVCKEIIEREISFPMMDGSGGFIKRKVHCMCKCERSEKEKQERRLQFEEEQRNIRKLKQLSLMDAKLKGANFRNFYITPENEKAIGIAKKYVENFGKMYRNGQGILFFGNIGTGKSYLAAAIANELIEQKKSVIMTSFVKLLGYDNDNVIESMNQAKLLVIDDLGAERDTDYAIERVYDIIDSRYRSKKPIIITTNTELAQMKKCDDIRYSRIYDRIFEMCYPVKMEGFSWRKKEAASRFAETRKILEG